jgi:putative SOS response-associated peptidase YedK
MCGRYATTRGAGDLAALFEAAPDPDLPALRPRYNLAPTDPAPVVRTSRRRDGRVLSVGRWGLLPHWARDRRAAARMINARAETVQTTPAYAAAFASRRALVPADGWYEWQRRDGARQAYFLTARNGSVLALAGLWSRWGDHGLLTFSVVTTAAAGDLAAVHDRMPLVLAPDDWDRWLTGAATGAAASLLRTPPAGVLGALEVRPVGPDVGNVRNDGPDLVARVDPVPAQDSLW